MTPVGSFSDTGQSVVLQPDGKILVGGYYSNGSQNEAVIVCYNTDGTLDNSFGTNSIANAAISVVPDPAIGSKTRRRIPRFGIRRRATEAAIRAGNGWTA